jgi:hypothetical protein
MTLRVKISIVPFGDESKEYEIERLNISNRSFEEGDLPNGDCPYVVEHNSYKNFDENTSRVSHSRSDGALVLVRKALEELGH